jgi:hypothetical protein
MPCSRRHRVCLVALTSLLATAALAAPAAAADPAAELATRYAPIVRLVEQKEPCGHGEPYVPTNVDLVLGNPEVALRGPWDTTNVVEVAPTAADISKGLSSYHLDFPGDALSPGCTYDEWSHTINEGSRPTVYARVVTEASHPGRLALQYWFFYVFNDFNDKHEGDWEMIQLDFDAPDAAAALKVTPELVGYSQHGGAEGARWGDGKLQIVGGTHPVVYPALGSHANYFSSALYLGRSAAEGVGCDDTVGPSVELRPTVSLIPSAQDAYLRADPWLGYDGHWGEEHQGFYNGPTGPNTKMQWTEPLTWADETWRDTSFTVPAGGSVGTNATTFFCGAVATGSNLLTALVGNPSPLLIAIAAVIVLLLWLSSRTRWEPSAPFRLRRGRRWGAIVTSARRMYTGHLRLFLGIGVLFIPLGVIITGVQYLVFRVGGLAPLVDSVGASNAFVATLALGLAALFTVVGLAIVQTVTSIAMVELDAGRRVGPVAVYRMALPRLPTVLRGLVGAALAIAILSLTGVGSIIAAWLAVRWSLIAQVVALEGLGARGALRRSGQLVRGDWWRVASLTLFVSTIGLLLGPLIGSLLLFVTSASFNFVNLVSSLVYAVVLPFVTIATTYLYFDLVVGERRERDEVEGVAEVLPAEI